ncbi:MAG: RNA polymerase subunit sigma [Cellulomonas sp. 73-145]|uniref:ECF RNA polymerase sigma factor SigK n=1 Tax=Cellulomonas sp. 73-145 TaxID=1895739 RepID=UPI0009270772|nr:ECF RNA polymerase sigma factor SigK [Cellulomonas sp. 73-145]OJV61026.1 MAG: RNA polymerase subunit sigma [Cellulomonas sp. 73-145]
MATASRGAPDEADVAPTTSVDDLLERAAGGDQQAFAQVYDALSSGVFGTCLAVLRDRDHAAEVTQEVMLELWRTAPRFDRLRGSARTWALTLAHRRAVDRVRSVQAERARDQRVMDTHLERPFDVVAEEVEGTMDRARVRQCLGGLTPTQHEAVVLAYYGGRTYREVADHLATPVATVKTRIRDGLIRLRDCLGVER